MNNMYGIVLYSDELEHHGILGQKWGIRRYQNKDGSLTEAGERRYKEKEKEGKYSEYEKLGLGKSDSFTAEYNKDKLKKGLLIAGGVVVTAAAVYYGRRFIQDNLDSVVKSGTKMQTILDNKNIDLGRNFYTAIDGLDKVRYGAIAQQQGFFDGADVYKHTIEVSKNFKIASSKSGERVFRNIIDHDNEFKKTISSTFKSFAPYSDDPIHGKIIKGALKELDNGKIGKNTYQLFNVQLAGGGFDYKIKDKFYNAMKEAGYAGVKDVNDMKFTNYWSNKPTIIFDGKSIVNKIKTDKITERHVKVGKSIVYGQAITGRIIAPLATVYGIPIATIATVDKASRNKTDPQKVADYRKKHPNSKKTYSEILNMLE